MKKNDAMITFKLPVELKVRLEQLASDDNRSLSNFIVHVLTLYTQNK